ncbi:dTDP-D-glucose 4,6-dehydratase [Aspergillus tubingensis]|uniref:dTDP-D-glucose 4,6-dehydratase n=1 Tax=Aspergillus niger TaxID=5061 RepID=A0A117E364_ASPNG|nr:dTDP-D-glucose 4,6-dehydratase [Aspergillus tubingensis]GAQ45770.1 dTDP-D-glucose 4,6-dehydratase [Aspergillus niger]GFN21667.1 dTDP-D-glucose 4,6-dehydratase [Aspergillus tubingensis]
MTITTIVPGNKGPTDWPGSEVKNILVTGGAGFIGSWMCHHLVHQYGEKYSVVCLDKLSNVSTLNNLKSVLNRPNFHFVQGNLHDKEHLIKVMAEYNIDSVIHFAAESSVQKSFSDPAAFVDMNVCATFRLLEAMNAYGKITRFLHASTDEVYGETWGVSVDEDTRMNPTNPYAASKAAAEMFVMAYQKSFEIPGMILRCNNIYGPCQYPEKLIPKFALLVRDGQKLTIQGNGSCTRNFVHVADVIAAYDTVLHKVRDVATGVLREFGHDIEKNFDEFIDSIPDRPYNDNDYVVKGDRLKELGWSQSVGFKEGLANTVQWYRKNGDNWWKEALGNQIGV